MGRGQIRDRKLFDIRDLRREEGVRGDRYTMCRKLQDRGQIRRHRKVLRKKDLELLHSELP